LLEEITGVFAAVKQYQANVNAITNKPVSTMAETMWASAACALQLASGQLQLTLTVGS